MEPVKIIGIGLVTAVLSVLLKQYRPELAFAIPLVGGTVILFCLVPYMKTMVEVFTRLADRVGIESQYLRLLLKMIGIAYLCQFGAELCRDAGENAVAGRMELAGKLMILSLSLPLVYQLLGLVDAIINF